MAILNREGADRVYAVARMFREQGLERVGSMLTPGRAVWTSDALDELHERFTLKPDTSGASFQDKLERQLAGASDDAVQLMAELLIVHFLINDKISGGSKRELLSTVLGWMEEPAALPDEVAAAMDYGIAWPGTFFNTGRDRQIRFLIEWTREWKQLSSQGQQENLADPWAFKQQILSVEINAAWLQRNAVLHLLFPEAFERIMARADKETVIAVFGDCIGGTDKAGALDEDEAILRIREALSPEYGEDFDFYETPAVAALWRGEHAQASAGDGEQIPVLDRVRFAYPDWTGFSDPRFVKDESTYKLAASENARTLLGAEALRELIDEGRSAEVVTRVEKVGQSTNLLWLQVPKDGDLALLYRQGLDAAEFAEAVYDLLYGEGESPERLERFAQFTIERNLPTKWALPTYLLMMVHPETDFFVKPQATKWFLKEMDAGFNIGSKASGELYGRLLEVVGDLRRALSDYAPHNTLDGH